MPERALRRNEGRHLVHVDVIAVVDPAMVNLSHIEKLDRFNFDKTFSTFKNDLAFMNVWNGQIHAQKTFGIRIK